MADYATRTRAAYFGQPRACLISTAWSVPQAGADGKIDQSWIPAGSGDVDSVTGTANQVTVSPTTGNVVVSLAGPHSFTTLTQSGILVGNGTSAISAPGATLTATALALSNAYTSGLQAYNTADQKTNFERVMMALSANTFQIMTGAGGSGTNRAITFGTANNNINVQGGSSTSGSFQFSGFSTGLASQINYALRGFTSTATSGTNISLSNTWTINQSSGTAANTASLINVVETALGSGLQKLIDMQAGTTGGLTRFTVLNGGAFGSAITSTATAAGTTTLTARSALIQIFTGSTTQTVQLPAANVLGSGVGLWYLIKNRSSGNVTIQRAGSDTIDGSTTLVLSSNSAAMIASNGTDLWVVL